MDVLISVFDALVRWLAHGFSGFSAWEIVAYTLVTTHITIAAVTIFLHRAQAHRALDLHGIHFTSPEALERELRALGLVTEQGQAPSRGCA